MAARRGVLPSKVPVARVDLLLGAATCCCLQANQCLVFRKLIPVGAWDGSARAALLPPLPKTLDLTSHPLY